MLPPSRSRPRLLPPAIGCRRSGWARRRAAYSKLPRGWRERGWTQRRCARWRPAVVAVTARWRRTMRTCARWACWSRDRRMAPPRAALPWSDGRTTAHGCCRWCWPASCRCSAAAARWRCCWPVPCGCNRRRHARRPQAVATARSGSAPTNLRTHGCRRGSPPTRPRITRAPSRSFQASTAPMRSTTSAMRWPRPGVTTKRW